MKKLIILFLFTSLYAGNLPLLVTRAKIVVKPESFKKHVRKKKLKKYVNDTRYPYRYVLVKGKRQK